MQSIDATPYRGKRLRFRAAVKMAEAGAGGRAQLWFRVDLAAQGGTPRTGFFDNMQDRRGHFYYRKYPMATAKTPMLHWGQATMYKALSTLLFRLDAAREQPTSAGLGRR